MVLLSLTKPTYIPHYKTNWKKIIKTDQSKKRNKTMIWQVYYQQSWRDTKLSYWLKITTMLICYPWRESPYLLGPKLGWILSGRMQQVENSREETVDYGYKINKLIYYVILWFQEDGRKHDAGSKFRGFSEVRKNRIYQKRPWQMKTKKRCEKY